MPGSLDPRQRSEVFGLICALVPGQVMTFYRLSEATGLSVLALQHMIDRLTDTERSTVPWHRVVAGGGGHWTACPLGRAEAAPFGGRHRDFVCWGREGLAAQDPAAGPAPKGGKAEAPTGGRARGPRSHPSSTVWGCRPEPLAAKPHALASAPPSRHNGATQRWASYD